MKLLLLGAVLFAQESGDPKTPYKDLPTDAPKRHVETIEDSRHEYSIEFEGAVDGTMTRMPIGYSAYVQGWQPTRWVRIENVGGTVVRNPRITVNGRGNWFTMKDIADEAVGRFTNPADRARAIYEFRRRSRFHACTWDRECTDALKSFNVYGYTLCGNEAVVLSDLWKTAGLKTRRSYPMGHVTGEVFYDGRFHLFDTDEHIICLNRDNKTVASAEEMVRDHDLIKRTHAYGIAAGDNRRRDEFSASLYVYEGKRGPAFPDSAKHSMDLTLRPGESIEFRRDHIGKQYTAGKKLKKGQKKRDGLGDLLAGWGPTAYDNLRNGKIRYAPDFRKGSGRAGILKLEDAQIGSGELVARNPAKPGRVTWAFSSPYVYVGGLARCDASGSKWRYRTGSEEWQDLPTSRGEGSLDGIISPPRKPIYRFELQLVLEGGARARKVTFDLDVQMSLLALPELSVGTNKIAYSDANEGARKVRITHDWLERKGVEPPAPPAEPIRPRDGGVVEGTRVAFKWARTAAKVRDFHFELSEHPDMRWPLSPNFEILVSKTAWRGKSEWTVPYVGLLNPGIPYYWRVRTLDRSGVWGPWSRTFSLTCEAPGVPLDVKLDRKEDGFVLAWKANPEGRAPVAYKVYGSDEKGFTVSDVEYVVHMGKGFVRTMAEYEGKKAVGGVKTPANLIGRFEGTSLRVVGADLSKPNMNRAYYRVVSIDAKGNESGPSDYAEVLRPYVYTAPPPAGKVGKPYRFSPGVVRSIGDLKCRRSKKSSYNAAFWEREHHEFAAEGLPPGLSIDASSGVISGTPKKAGAYPVALTVKDQFGKKTEVSYRLTVTE